MESGSSRLRCPTKTADEFDVLHRRVLVKDNLFNGVDIEKTGAFYYDWMMIAADFCTPVSAVKKVLPSERLQPIQVFPDTVCVSLVAMEYRQIDRLAPYNQFGVLVPVQYKAENTAGGLSGFYVYQLPVTTQEASTAGIKFFGYPGFVAQIKFDHVDDTYLCSVQAEGKEVIKLVIKQLETTPQSWSMYTFTVKDNQLLRARIQVQGQNGTSSGKGDAQYTLGDHPLADELGALDMDSISMGHQYAQNLQGILYLPEETLQL
jgi:hypothetical protein